MEVYHIQICLSRGKIEIPHDRILVAEVPRLRGFGCLGQPEFLRIRLHKSHYFFAWGICKVILDRLNL